ncbi:hypothetical protein BCR43DRAFT_489048 [Syncephalastrum racemosum]|uniref:Uncharacterized protein n=1 Tax=Syncephalastrum racemosum TaxID=13706 RepID=A0A1X2HJM4_SYNRA|nr:hypothetical protein BCR43DRAFT_489048 [Syncephalastrum racemosum]
MMWRQMIAAGSLVEVMPSLPSSLSWTASHYPMFQIVFDLAPVPVSWATCCLPSSPLTHSFSLALPADNRPASCPLISSVHVPVVLFPCCAIPMYSLSSLISDSSSSSFCCSSRSFYGIWVSHHLLHAPHRRPEPTSQP